VSLSDARRTSSPCRAHGPDRDAGQQLVQEPATERPTSRTTTCTGNRDVSAPANGDVTADTPAQTERLHVSVYRFRTSSIYLVSLLPADVLGL